MCVVARRSQRNEMVHVFMRHPAVLLAGRGVFFTNIFTPLMGTLKPQSNGPLYSKTVIGTLAAMGGLLHLVQRGGAWVNINTIK